MQNIRASEVITRKSCTKGDEVLVFNSSPLKFHSYFPEGEKKQGLFSVTISILDEVVKSSKKHFFNLIDCSTLELRERFQVYAYCGILNRPINRG